MDADVLLAITKILRRMAVQDLDTTSPIMVALNGVPLSRTEVLMDGDGEKRLEELLTRGYVIETIHVRDDPMRIILAELRKN